MIGDIDSDIDLGAWVIIPAASDSVIQVNDGIMAMQFITQ